MSQIPAHKDVTVGITNCRLSAVKRGIAVRLATQLSVAAQTEVCLVGADPTDRDVQRRMPGLYAAGEYRRMEVKHGPYSLEVARLLETNLTVVLLSDRAVVEPVLTRVREIFDFVVVDAPSKVGGAGVGIARALPPLLHAVVVASGGRADELAATQSYVDSLESAPFTRHLDRRVVITGGLAESGLARRQLQRKLAKLPLFDAQRASARAARPVVSDAIGPLVDWLIGLRNERMVPSTVRREDDGGAGARAAASYNYRQTSRSS